MVEIALKSAEQYGSFTMRKYANLFNHVKNWISQNKVEFASIILIFLAAALFRLYKIDQYMTFLGDEGRDMLVMKKIWVDHDLPFIGPPTSVGNMYLGPLYYYMMAVPTLLFWMNPVAAAIMNALIGVGTIGLLYYLCRIWWGRGSAIITSLLYTFSPVTIIYSRSSWNPNPAPFFALLSVIGLSQILRTKDFRWLILTGVAAAFAIQMHYLALLLLPFLGTVYLFLIMKSRKTALLTHKLSGTLFAIFAFLLLMSPLVLFDLKHHFMNYYAFKNILSGQSSVGASSQFFDRINVICGDILIGHHFALETDSLLNLLISTIQLFVEILAIYLIVKKKFVNWLVVILICWFIAGVIGLTFYKSSIYDHYVGFMNPTLFLFFGACWYFIGRISQTILRRMAKGLLLLFVAILVLNMQNHTPLQFPPNQQLQRTQTIAREVLDNTQGKPYNFALIAKSNYDSAYQFYLEQYGQKPGQLPFEKTDQLFVVCEDEECTPINNPKFEIAAFGMSKIEWTKDFRGVKLFKLIANPGGDK